MWDYIAFWLAKMAAELMVGLGVAAILLVAVLLFLAVDQTLRFFKRYTK